MYLAYEVHIHNKIKLIREICRNSIIITNCRIQYICTDVMYTTFLDVFS